MRFEGLMAATPTPFRAGRDLALDRIPSLVDALLASGVSGLYVCGSTGEGFSLTVEERCLTSEAYVSAVKGRVPVFVQVGHNSLREARTLAAHAQSLGVAAISANAPSYYPVETEALAASMAEIAEAASDTPFYYYHIPALTGASYDVRELLDCALASVPSFRGVKFSSPSVVDLQLCLRRFGDRLDFVWGVDEMLLAALGVGIRGAVGSTYNIAARLYIRLIEAFDRGEREEARRLQELSVEMVAALCRANYHASFKNLLRVIGLDCGPCRLPLPPLDEALGMEIVQRLTELGYFEWSGHARADA